MDMLEWMDSFIGASMNSDNQLKNFNLYIKPWATTQGFIVTCP